MDSPLPSVPTASRTRAAAVARTTVGTTASSTTVPASSVPAPDRARMAEKAAERLKREREAQAAAAAEKANAAKRAKKSEPVHLAPVDDGEQLFDIREILDGFHPDHEREILECPFYKRYMAKVENMEGWLRAAKNKAKLTTCELMDKS